MKLCRIGYFVIANDVDIFRHSLVIYKQPAFAYANNCKNTYRNSFYVFFRQRKFTAVLRHAA
jgi:hypothetical protein